MKILTHTKGVKVRGIKLKGKIKILSVCKLKRHIGHKYKKMFTPHSATLNIVDDDETATQSTSVGKNIPPDENISSITGKTSKHLSPKSKKKQCNKETADKYFTDDITNWGDPEQQEEEDNDWKIDNSNGEKEENDDDWMQITSREQRNLDSPIVVKMPLNNTALNVPKIFAQQSKTQFDMNTYDRNVFMRQILSKQDVHVFDSECVKPNSPVGHEELTSPMSWDANKTDKTESNKIIHNRKLKNVPNNKIGSAKSIPAHRESTESSERSTTSSNNYAKAYESPQLENTNEFDHESNPNSEAEDNADTSRLEDVSLQNFRDSRAHSHKIQQPQLYSIRNIVIVIMHKDSAFSFTGKLSVNVLYGAVEVYGAILNASIGPTDVYSPRGYSSVVISTCEQAPNTTPSTINDIWTILSEEGVTRDSETKLLEDISKVQPGKAVLVLQNIENNLTHFLKTYYPLRLFPDIKNSGYYPWTDYRRAEIVLQAQLQVKHYDLNRNSLSFDTRITNIASEMLARWRDNSWSCALVAGGKDVGKSTSVRFLINKLLHTCKKVVLVDMDPGQSECTPARSISYSLIEQPLLGPNFTHMQMPVYQLFIDEIDVMQCTLRYLKAMRMLITKLKSCPELSCLPIVVNTMGFTQHVGWGLVVTTVKLIKPSVVLQILSRKNKNNYRSFLNASIVNTEECKWIYHISSDEWNKPCDHKLIAIRSNAESRRVSKKWNMEPYQQRELALISYLSGITRDDFDPFVCNESLSLKLNEVVPYMSSFSSLCIVPQRQLGVPASHALNVINGNIVALCGIDLTESEESDDTSDLRVTYKTLPCTCYGFGIIRGVDVEEKKIFINTPLSISMMQHVNCLAGCIPIPSSLLQVNEGAPYVGVDAMLPTSREPRKGYFHMRHRNKSQTDDHRPPSQGAKLREDTVMKNLSIPQ